MVKPSSPPVVGILLAAASAVSGVGASRAASSLSRMASSPSLVHRLNNELAARKFHDVLPTQASGRLRRNLAADPKNGDGQSRRRAFEATEECPGTPFLWKVVDDASGRHVGFAVGTMHLPHDVVTTPGAWESITHAISDSCDVYGELNFYSANVTAEVQACSESFVQNSATVNDIPDEDLKSRILAKLEEIVYKLIDAGAIDVDPENVPTFVSRLGDNPLPSVLDMIAYANTPEYFAKYNRTLFYGDAMSLDMNMLGMGRPANDLEDVATQCDVIPKLFPSAEQLVENFAEMSPGIEATLTASYSELIGMYRCGNVRAFAGAIADDAVELDEVTDDVILTERNLNMAQRIDEILKAERGEERVMFAVGVAHWISGGEDSLEELLKVRGYTLEHAPQWSGESAEDHTNEHCGVIEHPTIPGLFVEDHGIPAPSPTDEKRTSEPTHNVVKPVYFTYPPTVDNSTVVYGLNDTEGLVPAPPTGSPPKDEPTPRPVAPSPPAGSGESPPSGGASASASKTMAILCGALLHLLLSRCS